VVFEQVDTRNGLHESAWSIEMNIEHISSNQPSPETRPQGASGGQEVIDLQQIKSIIYLGVKGKITAPAGETHRVDTFA
jgi:hypothetical protein